MLPGPSATNVVARVHPLECKLCPFPQISLYVEHYVKRLKRVYMISLVLLMKSVPVLFVCLLPLYDYNDCCE